MDSDLPAKRMPESSDCSLVLKRLHNESADVDYQHQTAKTNPSLSETVKSLRYGIFLIQTKYDKPLTEQILSEKYNYDAVFIPRESEEHYRIAFLFYESLQNRDESFHFNHKSNSIQFEEPAPNYPKSQIIDDFIKAFDVLNSQNTYKVLNEDWIQILKLSHKFIPNIIHNVIAAFEDFESTLYPNRESLWYVMLFKFYTFINKQWSYSNLRDEKDIIEFFKSKDLLSKFFTISDNNAYFCFDMIYQMMNDHEDDCSDKLIVLQNSQLMNNRLPESLHNFIPQSDILEIMCSNRVKSLFEKYIESSVYEETIAKIYEETHVVEMGKEMQGTTLFNHRICLTTFNRFKNLNIRKGLMILIFLHELGHYVTRMKISTAKMALDIKNNPKLLKEENKIKLPFGTETFLTENGSHVEEVLFGYCLETITYKAAEWISDPKNWALPDFQERFHKQNTDRVYNNRRKKEIRIRSRCPSHLIRSWCFNGQARLSSNYIC